MIFDSQPVLLVIDDNLSDIAFLESAWAQCGYDAAISTHACNSFKKAMTWLTQEIPPGCVVCGVLVDLMLFDEVGTSAVDRLSDLPILKGVPMVSWTGIDLGRHMTDRIRKSSTRVWQKPRNWMAWADFIRRFRNVLDGRSTAPDSGYATA